MRAGGRMRISGLLLVALVIAGVGRLAADALKKSENGNALSGAAQAGRLVPYIQGRNLKGSLYANTPRDALRSQSLRRGSVLKLRSADEVTTTDNSSENHE